MKYMVKKNKNIYSLLNKKFRCPYCNKKHFIPIKLVEKDIKINQIPSSIQKITNNKKILLLCDEITYRVAGRRIEKTFTCRRYPSGCARQDKWNCDVVILKPFKTEHVHADEKYFKKIMSRSKNKNLILTIGAGSITDMGKYIADKIGIPVVSFPTAPSMNAYTSSVTAFIKNGFKTTTNCKPTIGVLINKKILHNAPKKLIKAGFADSLAKCYGNADWKLSSILTNDYFCPLPLKIVSQSEKKYASKGRKLLNRNKKIIDALMDGLSEGGFSMIIAGISSPASGGEHLISHYLDMETSWENIEPYSYHGLQVGLGLITVSKIYDRLRKMNKKEIKKRVALYKTNSYEQKLRNIFKDRFHVVWGEFKNKQKILKKLPVLLVRKWDKIKKEVFPTAYPHKKIKKYLLNAKCPVDFHEIGVNKKLAYESIMNSRFIRDRLTILDIADELGILEEIARETTH